MLTIETLKEYGANVEEGLGRCMGKEDFYLKLVHMGLEETGYNQLKESIAAGDKKAAFEAAHSLKGVLGNLALTPLFVIASEMTELLRAGKDADYDAMLNELLAEREKLLSL